MTWEQLKEQIYYQDGSLRDIYVHNTTKEDWQIWADFVNTNYKVSFEIYETKVIENNITLNKVLAFWNGSFEFLMGAIVFLDNIAIKTYFFTDHAIENDITPREFNSTEDHHKLMNYLTALSKVLHKKIILTAA